MEAGASFQTHRNTKKIVYQTTFNLTVCVGYLDLVVAVAELRKNKPIHFELATYKFQTSIQGVEHSGDVRKKTLTPYREIIHTVQLETDRIPDKCVLLFLAVCYNGTNLENFTKAACRVVFNNFQHDDSLLESIACDIEPGSIQSSRPMKENSNVLICSLRKNGSDDIKITNHTCTSKLPSSFNIDVAPQQVANNMFTAYSDQVALPTRKIPNAKASYRKRATNFETCEGLILDVIDFDWTLTTIHLTNFLIQNPDKTKIWFEETVFGGKARLELIQRWLAYRCQAGHRVVVVSFGSTVDIYEALKKVKLLQFIDRIYGLAEKENAILMYSNNHLSSPTYKLYNKVLVTQTASGSRCFDKCSVVRHLHRQSLSHCTFFLDDDPANHCDFSDNPHIFMNVVGDY